MSWSLRKPDVRLAVTRFAPESAPVSAGLTSQQRDELHAARSREQAKVEPAIDLDADLGSDEPDDYSDYGDWKDDYSDAVGISRTKEL